jgi:hypothetical protein
MSPVRESPFEPATSLEVESNFFQIAQQNHFASQQLFISPAHKTVRHFPGARQIEWGRKLESHPKLG